MRNIRKSFMTRTYKIRSPITINTNCHLREADGARREPDKPINWEKRNRWNKFYCTSSNDFLLATIQLPSFSSVFYELFQDACRAIRDPLNSIFLRRNLCTLAVNFSVASDIS